MPRAVRFNQYGGLEVLQVVEVDRPIRGRGGSLSGSRLRASIRVRPRSEKESLPTGGLPLFLQGKVVISLGSWRRSAQT
jgi:hypothetical protein